MTTIVEITQYRPDYAQAVQSLLSQLSSSSHILTPEIWQQMLGNTDSHLFLLLLDDEPVGMISIGIYFTPTGGKAWIEDVVVDMAHRGMGLGRRLIEHAISYARSSGADSLMLTSRPARVAANRLYQSMGFEPRQTNVYKMLLR